MAVVKAYCDNSKIVRLKLSQDDLKSTSIPLLVSLIRTDKAGNNALFNELAY